MLAVVRHVETEKNLTGGVGHSESAVTPLGVIQLASLTAFLRRVSPTDGFRGLFYGDIGHVIHTVEGLATDLQITASRDQRLERIGLGVLRTASEHAVPDPSATARLNAWRGGALAIDRLDIPQGEDALLFIQRVKDFLQDQDESSGAAIVVCSQSTYICALNILLGYEEASVYRNFSVATGEMSVFDYRNDGWDCRVLSRQIE